MKPKEMDRKFQEGMRLMYTDEKVQEGADILMELVEFGHLDSIEQLVYIFLDQKNFDVAEYNIKCARDPNIPIILHLKARLIEESVGFEESIDGFKKAVAAGSPNACRRMFQKSIHDDLLEEAIFYLDKLRKYPEYFKKLRDHWFSDDSIQDLERELDELRERLANEAIQDEIQIDEIVGATVVISIESLTLENIYSEEELASTSNIWKKEEESIREYWKQIYLSGHPDTSRETLLSILKSGEFDERRLAALNPNLKISESATFYKARFESQCSEKFIEIQKLDDLEFERNFNINHWNLSREDLKATKGYIQTMVGKSLDNSPCEHIDEINDLFFDTGLVFLKGSKKQKEILKKMLPDIFHFFENLKKLRLIEPYLFWALDGEHTPESLNRTEMLAEHDSRILTIRDGLGDVYSVSFLQYPTEFYPLENVPENWIINIESGSFAVFSRMPPDLSNLDEELDDLDEFDLKDFGYETGTGFGDGYYPTIPFYDSLGALQNITTFFLGMGNSEYLDSMLSEPLTFTKVFENVIPIKLGHINSSGSLFFGDSMIIQNSLSSENTVLEFQDLPEEEFLVVAYIDTNIDDGNYNSQRTWAVSVLRDRAKRNYEILFEIFPELTNRKNDF